MSRRGDGVYRVLLRAFPKSIRDARGDDMARLFRLQRRRLAGRPVGLARLWVLAILDALWHGLAARMPHASSRRDRIRWTWQPFRDVRYAVRSLAAAPVPTVVAILALGLGIGANTAIVNVVYDVLHDPLRYPHPERVMLMFRQGASSKVLLSARMDDIERWRRAPSLESIAVYSSTQSTLGDPTSPALVSTARIDLGVLGLTGTRVVAGRAFGPSEVDSEAAARVALISDALWARRFGRAPDAVGRTIELDDVSYDVVGILPRSFRLPFVEPDVVLPFVMPRPAPGRPTPPVSVLSMARLAPDVSRDVAEAELTALAASANEAWQARLRPMSELFGDAFRQTLIVLTGAVACVLLIACANVGHLLLARNVARRRELAVRAALGASRRRLLGQLLTEHIVMAVAGGVLGAFIAWMTLEGLDAWRPADLAALEYVRATGLTYIFSVCLAILAGLAVGVLPAWSAAKRAANDQRVDGTRLTDAVQNRWVRRGISVAEVALALVLVCGAALLIGSYQRAARADLGFDPSGTVAVDLELGRSRYSTPAARQQFLEALAASLRDVPGVTHVAMAQIAPPRGGLYWVDHLEVEGRDATPAQFDGGVVEPGFFETLHIPIRDGRAFVPDDARAAQPPVAIVGARTAARLWPDRSAVGQRLRLDSKGPWVTVVGVAGQVTSRSSGSDWLQIYTPLVPSEFTSAPTILVRTTDDPDRTMDAIRSRVHAADGRVAISLMHTLETAVAIANSRPRFSATLLALLAGIGLLLAVTGVYGVINYSVGLRTREFGVCIALGAAPGTIGRSVLREAAAVALLGIAIGLAAWPLFHRTMASLVVGLDSNVTAMAGAALVLFLATLVAAWLPARRAVKVDPVRALRAEV